MPCLNDILVHLGILLPASCLPICSVQGLAAGFIKPERLDEMPRQGALSLLHFFTSLLALIC